MKAIEIGDDLYKMLEDQAKPFVETSPDAVLRRLLKHQLEYFSSNGQEEALGTAPETGKRRARQGKTRGGRSRAPSGSLLPAEEYELPILRALADRNGSAPSKVIIEAVGEELAGRLTQTDEEPLHSGEIRWHNRVQFTRLRLVEEASLKADSPRGTWELSDKGRQRLSREA